MTKKLLVPFCLAFSQAKKIEHMRNCSDGLWKLWGDCKLLCGHFEEQRARTEKESWKVQKVEFLKELRVAV